MRKNKNPVGTVDEEQYIPQTPERELWLAVIERALKDYCFFFDRISKTGNGHLVGYERPTIARQSSFNTRAISEWNRLRWFLFDTEIAPFNLEYLTSHLYDDGDGMALRIRKEAIAQFKRHFDEAEKIGRFQAIMDYIKQTTKIEVTKAAEIESTLRYKRYRLQP